MSDIDFDRENDDLAYDDNSHQVCYVFKPRSSTDLDPITPASKRQKTKHNSDYELRFSFPLLSHGAEATELAELRFETYRKSWTRKCSRITELVNKVNEAGLTKVEDFINSPKSTSSEKLQVGLVVSGPGGNVQTRLKERWRKRSAQDSASIVIQLSASHCTNIQTTLKNIIRSTISSHSGQDGYQEFLNKHKRLLPMNYDLELLQIYANEKGLRRIVLSILDVETFDIAILSDLLSMLSSWTEHIPFTLLLGIATTVELFESRLPKSIVDVLDTTIFRLQSSDHALEQILDDLRSDEDPGVRLGPVTISSLEELMQSQSMTVEVFISAIRYMYMSHFFANSLSVLLSDELPSIPEKSLCTAIRNTPSFQQYCEDLLSSQNKTSKSEVSKLFHNDSALYEAALLAVKTSPSTPSKSSSKQKSKPIFVLSEATTISTRQLLHPFHPRPRYALERALNKPSDYLGCECCARSDTIAPSFSSMSAPPTSTLYTLLQEAGTIINVRDLYDAFCARSLQLVDPDLDAEDAGINSDKADRAQLAAFYDALAELKMLGLVKSSTSAVVKKRAVAKQGANAEDVLGIFSGRGRDRHGDIDFVAKTGWIGL